jgi:hypothetical protein
MRGSIAGSEEAPASASLPGASMVRTSKIATVEHSRIVRRIGTLAKRERSAVRKAVVGFAGKTRSLVENWT